MTTVEGGTQPTDPRVLAVGNVLITRGSIEAALTAADKADREAGYVRVRVDDAAIERVEAAWFVWAESYKPRRDGIKAMIAALTGEQS